MEKKLWMIKWMEENAFKKMNNEQGEKMTILLSNPKSVKSKLMISYFPWKWKINK